WIERPGALANARTLFPRSGRVGMKWTSQPKLALIQRFRCRIHVGIVRRTISGKYTFLSRRVRLRPTRILVVAKTKTGNLRISTRPQNRQSVNAIEAPATQPQRLQNQLTVERSDR